MISATFSNPSIVQAAGDLLAVFKECGLTFASAESCTGGLITASLTAIEGSSSVVDRGFVTYTNEAKHDLLGVPYTLFDSVGAVSSETACAMAAGALEYSQADIVCAVTGVAGPGQSELKPAGLVYIAVASRSDPPQAKQHFFQGDRDAVREASVLAALKAAIALASKQ